MTVNADLQKLEPGAEVRLYDLDLTIFGEEMLRFHGHNGGVIVWQGNEYYPWPLQATGFERTSQQPPRPSLQVGNIDASITSLCSLYDDLLGAKVTQRRTFKKYLDAVNFEGGVNPDADPDEEFPPEVWYIDRKANETAEFVEFELASAMEFQNAQLPGRQIVANFCPWVAIGGYRGPYCGYTGGPVAKVDDTPTSDPNLDRCGGRLTSCKLRFGESAPLPFGGFPAAGLIRG